jgi:hypothetical protein
MKMTKKKAAIGVAIIIALVAIWCGYLVGYETGTG